MDLTALAAQAAAAAETSDQSVQEGGFTREVAPAGFTTARFVGYVETGHQEQNPYQGVAKPDAPEVRLTFELNGPKQITTYQKDGETHTASNSQRERITIGTSEKSNFQKMFKAMLAGRSDIKHMAMLLGEGFLIKISHSQSKDGKKTYANMKVDGVWNIQAPAVTDPITNETTILDVPAATMPIQLLLQAAPTKEQWDSIFIDGTYTKKDGDNEIQVSKNFIQEECMASSSFVGSPLEAMLAGLSGVTDGVANGAAGGAAGGVAAEPKPVPAPTVANDPLAALNL
jgi:hypothetical protein